MAVCSADCRGLADECPAGAVSPAAVESLSVPKGTVNDPLHDGWKGSVTTQAIMFISISGFCGGGDTLTVASGAARELRRRSALDGRFGAAIVLLESDRLVQDQGNRRDPETAVRSRPLQLIGQRPNLEGLLLRLHSGSKKRFIAAGDTKRLLRKEWPDYPGKADATAFARRFTIHDLQRVARFDDALHKLLRILGLPIVH